MGISLECCEMDHEGIDQVDLSDSLHFRYQHVVILISINFSDTAVYFVFHVRYNFLPSV